MAKKLLLTLQKRVVLTAFKPSAQERGARREALRSQFSRIRETVTRILNDDTTLAERLRTLFREHGVTIASLLNALGFIISTVVLSIQNALGGKIPAPGPTITTEHGAAEWVKNN